MHVVPAFTLRLRVQVHSNRIFPLGVQTDARRPIESSGLEVVSFSSIKMVKPEYGCEQCQVQELGKVAGGLSESELEGKEPQASWRKWLEERTKQERMSLSTAMRCSSVAVV